MRVTLKRAFQEERSPGKVRVTSHSKIKAILLQLKTEHALLSVTLPGCKDPANSAILGIDANRGLFYLDELNPATAHQALLRAGKLRIHCRVHGMQLDFAARLRNTDSDGGLALYEMAWPEVVSRQQRRENFRLRLIPGPPVALSVPGLADKSVNGEAFDLSAGGIGAYLHTKLVPDRGQTLAGTCLSLPQTRPLITDLEVRFARQDTLHRVVRIGARFIGLDTKQERQIAQFLAEQQRKRRRHGPR